MTTMAAMASDFATNTPTATLTESLTDGPRASKLAQFSRIQRSDPELPTESLRLSSGSRMLPLRLIPTERALSSRKVTEKKSPAMIPSSWKSPFTDQKPFRQTSSSQLQSTSPELIFPLK